VRETGLPGALARLQRSNFGACRICVMEIPPSTIKLGAMATRGFTPSNLIESLQLLGPKNRSLSVILFFAAERPRALLRLPHAVENLPEWVHYLVKKICCSPLGERAARHHVRNVTIIFASLEIAFQLPLLPQCNTCGSRRKSQYLNSMERSGQNIKILAWWLIFYWLIHIKKIIFWTVVRIISRIKILGWHRSQSIKFKFVPRRQDFSLPNKNCFFCDAVVFKVHNFL
jgi:hypothetical protein